MPGFSLGSSRRDDKPRPFPKTREKDMTMREFFSRLKRRTPSKPAPRDWSSSFTPHDWADLPTHHPRRETDAQ